MPYNPQIHHRRSIRLKGYDYSQEGLYFITICTQDRECLFGEITRNGKEQIPVMQVNEAGIMIEQWYWKLEEKYPDKRCHEMVVMPNHFHCIIENIREELHDDSPKYGPDNQRLHATANDAVDWFKTMTTNAYIRGVKEHGWQRFNGKLWQRNYWEHIIRDERAYENISHYIQNNPIKWGDDKLYRVM